MTKTIEQVIKAINFRLNMLETFNKELSSITITSNDGEGLMHIYFENEARMSELSSLLDYIQSEKDDNGKT